MVTIDKNWSVEYTENNEFCAIKIIIIVRKNGKKAENI